MFDKLVKLLTGSFLKEIIIPEKSSDDCFPLPKTDVMPIQIRNAPSACTFKGYDSKNEEKYKKKIVFISESGIDYIMSQNLTYFICCPRKFYV
jgi:hypothetical protein